MSARSVSLKLASTHGCAVSTNVTAGNPATIIWPTCNRSDCAMRPALGARTVVRSRLTCACDRWTRAASTCGLIPLDGPAASLVRARSEEHTSELQSLMRISYAVFCLKKKHKQKKNANHQIDVVLDRDKYQQMTNPELIRKK